MSGIEFQHPPTPGGRRTDWASIAEALRARPGEWALVGEHAVSTSQAIKIGRLKAFRPGGFETTTRNVREGRGDLYVRYVGEEPA